MTIIRSIREQIGVEYNRPDKAKVDEFVENLNNNHEPLEYLKTERGLTDDTISHFKLGYDPRRDAISIPIYKNGELVNIKYRFLKPNKFKYSSERGAEIWLYNDDGINVGMKKDGVLIVEGEFDLMSVWQSGIKNVISPASGKDSYGIWIERIDNIPKVYIAYDNDKGGKDTAMKMAERLGIDKSYEVCYPEDIKDANEFFKSYTKEEFRELIKSAKPYYNYQFRGLGDIIESLRTPTNTDITTQFIPNVKIEKDWLMIVSGKTNVGKTAYVLNVADDFVKQDEPVLIMPFERGIDSVGKRFMSVMYDKSCEDFSYLNDTDWIDIVDECIDKPLYFSVPKKDEIVDTIIKSKRLFNTKVVIVDHLDYLIRHVSGNREAEIANTLQGLKRVAEEHKIVIIIVTHIRKIEQAGSSIERKPNMDDLKGSSSLSQDPECVVLLNPVEEGVEVCIAKNKGKMGCQTFDFNPTTGRFSLSEADETWEAMSKNSDELSQEF